MSRFNLNNIIQEYGLDKNVIASILFPDVKYPRRALTRIIKEKGELSVGQLEKLAQFIGLPVNNLFELKEYEIKSVENQLIFKKGDYCIKIYDITPDSTKQNVTIFNGKTMSSDTCNINNLTVAEMLDYLNNLTILY